MKLIDGCKARQHVFVGGGGGDGDGDGGGGDGEEKEKENKVVVVGVKFDKESRELLTWALVKVSRPGDLVIALHVLSQSNEEEQSTLLALVKTFDSVLSVYEGFCHLKQVDLKLKVSRGPSVRKILVREAKRHQGATVIVGISKTLHMIRSPVHVAKYCARRLSHDFSVIAVDNGKIVFRREASVSSCGDLHESLLGETVEDGSGDLRKWSCGVRRSAAIRKYFGCGPKSSWKDYATNQFSDESDEDSGGESPLALLPFQKPVSDVRKVSTNGQVKGGTKQGWSLLRSAFVSKQPVIYEASTTKTLRTCRLPSIRSWLSLKSIHSDVKHSGDLVKTGAVVPLGSSASTPRSSDVHESVLWAKEFEGLHEKYSSTCRLFPYQELKSATSNFSHERLIGKGGSSQVFRGSFSDGQEVAVKILKPSEDALREFTTEIEIITAIKHKNIISLFGYCIEAKNPILVYNYLPRGSLEENLHGTKDVAAFGWKERYNVALGVAEALNYLHNESSRHVIHRDVKSSNILLSNKFEPQLADFGLASWASDDSSYKVYTDVAGTFGYLAPEYFMHGKVTEKIDVYAYGVVLLELLSGRKPIDNKNPKGPQSLVIWASRILQDGKISELLDPKMSIDDYDHDQLERLALSATLCIRRAPQLRPGISIILKLLQGDVEVTTWAKQQANDSTADDGNALDGETSPHDIQSFLNIAFLDMEDDSISISSPERNISIEEYLQGRWSRTPSFH